jgi:hypothetical protein
MTKSDNELIAEFMGVPQINDNGVIVWDYQATGKKIYCLESKYLHYDTSWDWLMPVVQAIEDLEEPHPSNDPTKGTVWPYQVEILSRSVVQIIDNRNDESLVLVDDQDPRKIDSVYKAVVAFIKWYNSQKVNPVTV